MKLDHKTIVFQGDSITDMARGRNTWDQNHLYGHSYVFLLAGKWGYETPEKEITVYNRGVSGDRSVDVAARWQEEALDFHPDVISLLVGINDILCGMIPDEMDPHPSVDVATYRDTIRAMFRKAREQNPDVTLVIGEPFSFPEAACEEYRATFREQVPLFQQAAREIAREFDAVFVPLQEKFEEAYRRYPDKGYGYWIWDGIHPTAAGQQIIARQWENCVQNH